MDQEAEKKEMGHGERALIPRNDCVEDLLLKCKVISPLIGGND